MDLVVEPHGVNIAVDTDRPLLFSALNRGVTLPYECASGSCGACKARLLEGEVESLWEDAPGLTDRDRRKGSRVLLCQSVPVSDCRVLAGEREPEVAHEPTPVRLAARVVRHEIRASFLVLEVDVGCAVDFLAGQFAIVELADGTRRAYSMSTAPSRGSVLQFIVKEKPGGRGTTALFAAEVGDVLTLEGPYGLAHLRESGRPVVCVGGGSGIGPMLSIADRALSADDVPEVALYFGVRNECELVFDDRLAEIDRDPRGSVQRVVESARSADLRDGFVHEAMLADWPDLSEHDLYVAGPPAMVDAVLRDVVRAGVARADRVFFDRFT